jgi:hypothetical protein
VRSEAFERRDSPAYDGVYLFGQQQGAAAFVRLAGTTGANLHPVITDLLLTDDAACAQRGAAVLGGSGEKQDHTLTLPFLAGAGEPGAMAVNWLMRVVEPAETWYGLVRRVSIQAALPSITQSVVVERHMEPIPGTVAAPALPAALLFTGPIADQTVNAGAAFSLALALFFSLGQPPYRYSMRSGSLPAWVTPNWDTGVLSGTAPGAAAAAVPLQFRATDALNSTADTNVLQLSVVSAGTALVLGRFDGSNGQTAGVPNEGTLGGNWNIEGLASLSTAWAFNGATSLRMLSPFGSSANRTPRFAHVGLQLGPAVPQTLEFRLFVPSGVHPPAPGWNIGVLTTSAPVSGGFRSYYVVVFSQSTTQFSVRFDADGIGPGLTLNKGQQYHIAASLNAGTLRGFVDGVMLAGSATATGTAVIPTAEIFAIGPVSHDFEIFVDDLRFRRDFAYTANFTPPASV